jgi:hypothetical protein
VGSYPWMSAFLAGARRTAGSSWDGNDGLGVIAGTPTITGLTGIAADSPLAGATGAHADRRLISVAAMFPGALAGALLVLPVRFVCPLVIALVILAVAAVTAVASARSPRTPRSPAA